MGRTERLNFVDRGGWRIAYSATGDVGGPPVLFGHGLGLDHHSWDAEARRLSDRYHVIRIDTRGHGRSDTPPDPYTLEEIGSDVLAVAEHVGLSRFHAVGLSLGGLTTLWLAIHRPERLLSATYCNTAARLGNDELWRDRIAAVSEGMTGIVDTAFPRFFTPDWMSRNPALVERARRTFLSTDPRGYAGCCAVLRDADLRPAVTDIDVPSLIMGGAEDLATPPAESQWLHEQITGSELVLIEGAAHISNLERPEVFGDALERHLQRN